MMIRLWFQGLYQNYVCNINYKIKFQIMRAKSAMVRKAGTIENQMQHQNQKNKMLEEDRRLFLRQAQEIKEKYNQEIEKLKNQNKKLKSIRDEFIASKKNRCVLANTAYNSTGSKLGITATDENYLRIMLDKEKHQTKIKKNLLFTLQDKLKEVQDNKLGYIEENPMMRTIRILQNRLDKVMIKYNEAQSIQQTYEQVVKRLKEERVGYDSQLAAIENCLKGKEHDFQELLLLAHDATHAKEAAFAELKRFQQRRVTVQDMRKKYVQEKKVEINKDIPQTAENASKGERSNFNNKTNPTFGNSYKHDENYQRQELNDYEQAFRKLKEVTGVIDANEIIQKFKTQGLTTDSLQELQSQYSKKIQNLKRQKEELKRKLEARRFENESNGQQRRRLDQIEEDLARTTNQYERTNIKYSKLSNSMINITAGIQHLKELTIFYKKEPEGDIQSLESDLKNLNEKLRKIYDTVKADPNYTKHSYKATASAIQSMMKEQNEYKNYKASNLEEEDQEDQN